MNWLLLSLTRVGRDYPERVVIHEEASENNQQKMTQYRQKLLEAVSRTNYCHASSQREAYQFFGIELVPVRI